MAEIFDFISPEALTEALAGKSDTGHLHAQYITLLTADARYYQKSEVDTLLTAINNDLNAIDIGTLDGVDLTGVVDGNVLIYDGASGKFTVGTLAGGGGTTDHGALTGKDDDDHPQYLTEARGDARYFTQSQITANYYDQAAMDTALNGKSDDDHEHALADLSNVNNTAPTDGQALVYDSGAGTWGPATITEGGGGATDHGALTGKGDDDHPQYHTDARGDARYYTKTELDAFLAAKQPAVSRVRISANHTALLEQIIAVDTDVAAVTITAPASPSENDYFRVGDAGGNAANNKITIDFGAETFDGGNSTFVIDMNAFGSGFIFNGTEWELFDG